MPEVLLGGRSVPYLLVRNPRSRHVRMTLTPDGLRSNLHHPHLKNLNHHL